MIDIQAASTMPYIKTEKYLVWSNAVCQTFMPHYILYQQKYLLK